MFKKEECDGFFVDGCDWVCGVKRWCFASAQGGQRVDNCVRVDGDTLKDIHDDRYVYKLKYTRVFGFLEKVPNPEYVSKRVSGAVSEEVVEKDEDRKLGSQLEEESAGDGGGVESEDSVEGGAGEAVKEGFLFED